MSDPYLLYLANKNMFKLKPNTFLITCEYDALRDEGLILNERMKKIKHPLQHLHLSGSEHGVLLFSYNSVYKTSLEKIVYYIQ